MVALVLNLGLDLGFVSSIYQVLSLRLIVSWLYSFLMSLYNSLYAVLWPLLQEIIPSPSFTPLLFDINK